MIKVQYLTISADEAGQRVDNYLLRILKGVPKSHIYRIIRDGQVRINKKRCQALSRLQAGDILRVPPVRTGQAPKAVVHSEFEQVLQKAVIYEDGALLVINKPSGLAVHGGSGLSLGLIEAMRNIRQDLPYLELVHRLDRETSGCLVLAKKRSALRALHALLEARQVEKCYAALLMHRWQGKTMCDVNAPLRKNTLQSGERMACIDEQGKASLTTFTLLENFDNACLVEAKPQTGRTHQIRIHAASLGHPIIGDVKYGAPKTSELPIDSKRLYLHARSIQFTLNGQDFLFEAKLEPRFAAAIRQLAHE